MTDVDARFRAAATLLQQGAFSEAERLCREILAAEPDDGNALYLSAVITLQTGRPALAVTAFASAISADPDNPSLYQWLGIAQQQLGDFAAALDSFDAALRLRPDFGEASYNRGNALLDLTRPEDALAAYDRAIAEQPDHLMAQYNRGVALQWLGRLDEAVANYDKVLAQNPKFVGAHNNRANALKSLGRFNAALIGYDNAIALEPSYSEAHTNRAIVLQNLGRFREAIGSHDRAIALKPQSAEAHFNASLCHLTLGDFTRGWAEYEWRWKQESFAADRRVFAEPLWTGKETLKNKTILLHSEQGLGDTLQFCRYAGLLKSLGAEVILEVQRPLAKLLKEVDGVADCLARGEPLPIFDYHCPFLSLPKAFGTDIATIPLPTGYLKAPSNTLDEWRIKLGEKTRPRIGLVWSGRPGHSNDVNRSIPLADFTGILNEGADYVSLQQEVREADRVALQSRHDIRHLGDDLTDFCDTAALCELLDLIVTVDTSVAHLAGAMAKPVWVLLPFVPDWRWLLHREDSPWYASARLFRQDGSRLWGPVIADAQAALHNVIRGSMER